AAAILSGVGVVWVARAARVAGAEGVMARRVLQGHWVVLFATALAAPVLVAQQMPDRLGLSLLVAGSVAVGVVASALAWRRGSDVGLLAPLAAATAVALLVGYGVLGPERNDRHSHRALASTLDRILPPETTTVMFFHEL